MMKKAANKCFRFLLLILLILLALCLFEIFLRLYSHFNPALEDRFKIESFFHPLHPYFGHDDRSPYMPEPIRKDDKRQYTILVLGGSTALDIPEPLEKYLNEKNPFPDISRFVVYNGAHHGYHSTQDKNVLVHYLSNGSEIDMVVCIEGFNNLIRPLENYAYGLPPNYTGWYWIVGNRLEYGSPTRYYLAKYLSELAKKPLIKRLKTFQMLLTGAINASMRSYHLQGMEAVQDNISSIPDKEKIEVLRTGSSFYEDDIRFMDAVALLQGVRAIFVLHPIMGFERKEMTTYEKEFLKNRPMYDFQLAPLSVWVEGYRSLQGIGRELKKAGVDYLDYTAIFRDTEGNPYRDLMHMNELGWNAMAEKLANDIIKTLKKERPAKPDLDRRDTRLENPHGSPQN